MSYNVAGHCGKCGAPYYSPDVWHGTGPVPMQPSCGCWNLPQTITTTGITIEAQPQADNTQSAAIAQIAARLEQRVLFDRQMSSEEAWQDVVTKAVRQLRAL